MPAYIILLKSFQKACVDLDDALKKSFAKEMFGIQMVCTVLKNNIYHMSDKSFICGELLRVFIKNTPSLYQEKLKLLSLVTDIISTLLAAITTFDDKIIQKTITTQRKQRKNSNNL